MESAPMGKIILGDGSVYSGRRWTLARNDRHRQPFLLFNADCHGQTAVLPNGNSSVGCGPGRAIFESHVDALGLESYDRLYFCARYRFTAGAGIDRRSKTDLAGARSCIQPGIAETSIVAAARSDDRLAFFVVAG